MRDILKKAMIPIFLSIVVGGLCGRVVYKIYLGNTDLVYDGNLIYLVQSGVYNSYDNMRASTIGNNYVYYEEDDVYKTVIGITKNKNNIEKIKSSYEGDVIVSQYYVDDDYLNSKMIEYDNKLLKEENVDNIRQIILEMLDLYKKENNVKLIKIS